MKTVPFALRALPLALLTLTLGACGGGGGGGSSGGSATSTITGTASKGTLSNAIVTAYKVTDSGQKGDKIGETRTNTDGGYTLSVSGYSGPVLLEMTSDGATEMTCDIPSGCDGGKVFGAKLGVNFAMESVIPELKASNTTAITPFTHLAAEYAKHKGLNKLNIEAALGQVADLFQLPDLNSKPSDATGDLATASADAQRYAVMNAAIGQLAGSVADIATVLAKLSSELNTHEGQLQSSGAAAGKLDLADVLDAASTVTQSGLLKNVDSTIKTKIAVALAEAQKSTDVTIATPSDLSGADSLTKAKAFVNAAGHLLSNLEQMDDQSFVDTIGQHQMKGIHDLTQGDRLLGQAVNTALGALVDTIDKSGGSNTLLGPTEINAYLAGVSNPYQMVFTVSPGAKISIDSSTRKATFEGEIKLQPKKWGYLNSTWQTVDDGNPQGFTISGLSLSWPDLNTPATRFKFAISPQSIIKTANIQAGFASNSDSHLILDYAQSATLQHHWDALRAHNNDASELPVKAETQLDRVTIRLLNAASDQISQFVGSAKLTGIQGKLDTTAGVKQVVPQPQILTMSGAFTSVNGDNIEATATADVTGSNPMISPEAGFVRHGLYSYNYNAGANTVTLTAGLGRFYWVGQSSVTFGLIDNPSYSSCPYYLNVNGSARNCTTAAGAVDAFKEYLGGLAVSSYPYYDPGTNTIVAASIKPVFGAGFNYFSTTEQAINGLDSLGKTVSGVYTYNYDAVNKTVSLSMRKSTYAYSTQVFSVTDSYYKSCPYYLTYNNANGYYCAASSNIAEAFRDPFQFYWMRNLVVENEGLYSPILDSSINYFSGGSQPLDGKLINTDGMMTEDSTHQIKGAITVATKLKLVGNAAADIDANLSANYTGQKRGNLTAAFRLGNDKITVTATQSVVDGKLASITLTNQDGVSVTANRSANNADINEIKVGGEVQGWLYMVNGLPVVKFKDNAIKAL